jgi:putative acetyltransferase
MRGIPAPLKYPAPFKVTYRNLPALPFQATPLRNFNLKPYLYSGDKMSLLGDKEVSIREFIPGDAPSFRSLNEDWITKYFRIEPKDEKTFADPEATILNPGGRILFAVAEGRCVGCCALLRISDNEFEVVKMAVTPAFQGMGIARKLLLSVIETARVAGAHRLYLETNHQLTPAIRLYESVGFTHLDPSRITPSPYARADVFMELNLK